MLAVLTQYQSVADRQTDGQTELMYAYQCDARRIRTPDNNVTGLISAACNIYIILHVV